MLRRGRYLSLSHAISLPVTSRYPTERNTKGGQRSVELLELKIGAPKPPIGMTAVSCRARTCPQMGHKHCALQVYRQGKACASSCGHYHTHSTACIFDRLSDAVYFLGVSFACPENHQANVKCTRSSGFIPMMATSSSRYSSSTHSDSLQLRQHRAQINAPGEHVCLQAAAPFLFLGVCLTGNTATARHEHTTVTTNRP